MIDQRSAVSTQQSVMESGLRTSDVATLKDDYKKVAKEMESLFAYQLLKVMRETTDNLSDDKKENGYDTYMTMFDMEVSRLFADRGIGLQDAIINWLERSHGINDKNIDVNKKQD